MASIIKVDTIQTAAGGTPTAADLGLNTTGTVLQVINATTSTETTETSGSWVDTTLTATITPTSTSSKILVTVHQTGLGKQSGNTSVDLRLLRDSTVLKQFERAAFDAGTGYVRPAGSGITYLDSPSTTSAVTYKTQLQNDDASGTVIVQMNGAANSSITLMEIAG